MAATQPKEDDSPRTVGGNREGCGSAPARTGGQTKQLECPTLPAAGRPRVAVTGNWNVCDPERVAGPPYARDTRNSSRHAMDRLGAGLYWPISYDRLPDRKSKGELNQHENGK